MTAPAISRHGSLHKTVRYPITPHPLKALSVAGVVEWLRELVPNLKVKATVIAQQLLATTDGIPLFLRFIVDDIRQYVDAGIPAYELKQGLMTLPAPFTDYAVEQLDAMRKLHGQGAGGWDVNVQRIFALLTLIRGAMPAFEIATVSGARWDVTALDARVTRWFAIRTGEQEPSIAFLHPSLAKVFRDALVRRAETQGFIHEVEQRLIQHCAAWRTNGSSYGLTYLPWHLAQSGETKQAFQALTSIDFLSARVSHRRAPALIAQTLADFTNLTVVAPDALKPAARSWLNFWATVEPHLLERAFDQRPDEVRLVLRQTLADTLGLERDANGHCEISKMAWCQLSGKRAPSNLLRTLGGHTSSVNGALVLADGRLLSWSDDHSLRLWAADGAPLGELEGHTGSVNGALVLTDGCLLSWGHDRSLRLWAADGAPRGELRGHTSSVNGAQELADGRLLSWSVDHSLRLWAADGAPRGELRGQCDEQTRDDADNDDNDQCFKCGCDHDCLPWRFCAARLCCG
jgi:WD domain, G-beta repeat